MANETTTILVNKEKVEIPTQEFTCLVHQQGIRVNVPDFIEINSRDTIKCMEEMSQRAWEHISTGDLFQNLFKTIWDENEVSIPLTIQELNEGDYGVIHVCGLIVLACEALFEGNTKLFFRTPEDHLHPKTEQKLVSLLKKLGLAVANPEPPEEGSLEAAVKVDL